MEAAVQILGLSMIVLGLLMLLFVVGLFSYFIWQEYRAEAKPAPEMRGTLNPANAGLVKTILKMTIIGAMLISIAAGFGVLTWLSPIDPLNPAQESLLGIADWMIKGGIGALAGIVIWGGLTARKPKAAASG